MTPEERKTLEEQFSRVRMGNHVSFGWFSFHRDAFSLPAVTLPMPTRWNRFKAWVRRMF